MVHRLGKTFSDRISAWLHRYLFQTWRFRNYRKSQTQAYQLTHAALRTLINQTGIAVTNLRSQGIVRIGNGTYFAISKLQAIHKDAIVIVVDVQMGELVVEKKQVPPLALPPGPTS